MTPEPDKKKKEKKDWREIYLPDPTDIPRSPDRKRRERQSLTSKALNVYSEEPAFSDEKGYVPVMPEVVTTAQRRDLTPEELSMRVKQLGVPPSITDQDYSQNKYRKEFNEKLEELLFQNPITKYTLGDMHSRIKEGSQALSSAKNLNQTSGAIADMLSGTLSGLFNAFPLVATSNVARGFLEPYGEKIAGETGKEVVGYGSQLPFLLSKGGVSFLSGVLASKGAGELANKLVNDSKLTEEEKNRVIETAENVGFFGGMIGGSGKTGRNIETKIGQGVKGVKDYFKPKPPPPPVEPPKLLPEPKFVGNEFGFVRKGGDVPEAQEYEGAKLRLEKDRLNDESYRLQSNIDTRTTAIKNEREKIKLIKNDPNKLEEINEHRNKIKEHIKEVNNSKEKAVKLNENINAIEKELLNYTNYRQVDFGEPELKWKEKKFEEPIRIIGGPSETSVRPIITGEEAKTQTIIPEVRKPLIYKKPEEVPKVEPKDVIGANQRIRDLEDNNVALNNMLKIAKTQKDKSAILDKIDLNNLELTKLKSEYPQLKALPEKSSVRPLSIEDAKGLPTPSSIDFATAKSGGKTITKMPPEKPYPVERSKETEPTDYEKLVETQNKIYSYAKAIKKNKELDGLTPLTKERRAEMKKGLNTLRENADKLTELITGATNVKENKTGLSGEIKKGSEPVKGQVVKSRGGKTAIASGVVQKAEGKKGAEQTGASRIAEVAKAKQKVLEKRNIRKKEGEAKPSSEELKPVKPEVKQEPATKENKGELKVTSKENAIVKKKFGRNFDELSEPEQAKILEAKGKSKNTREFTNELNSKISADKKQTPDETTFGADFGLSELITGGGLKSIKENFHQNTENIKNLFAEASNMISNGYNTFKAFSKKMVSRFGDNVRPYLRGIWDKVKYVGEEVKDEFAKQIINYAEKKGLIETAVNGGMVGKGVEKVKSERPKTKSQLETERKEGIVDETSKLLLLNPDLNTLTKHISKNKYLSDKDQARFNELKKKKEVEVEGGKKLSVAELNEYESLLKGYDVSNANLKKVKLPFQVAEANPVVRAAQIIGFDAYTKAGQELIQLERKFNDLFKKARDSRGKLRIFKYDEAVAKALSGEKVELTKAEKTLVDELNKFAADTKDIMTDKTRLKHYDFPHLSKGFVEDVYYNGLKEAIKNKLESFGSESDIVEGIKDFTTISKGEVFNPFAMKRIGRIEPTYDLNKRVQAYLDVYTLKKNLDPVLPTINRLNQALSVSGLTKSAKWLQDYYAELQGKNFSENKKLDKTIDIVNKFNVIRFLWGNTGGFLTNLFAGEFQNIRNMKFKDYVVGHARLFEMAKGIDLLTKQNVITMGDAQAFASRRRFLSGGLKNLPTIGYNIGEKIIQGSYYLGKLTKSEYQTGEISAKRHRTILEEIASLQGGYRKGLKVPLLRTTTGKAILPFRRWLPAVISNQYEQIKNSYNGIKEIITEKNISEKNKKSVINSLKTIGIGGSIIYFYFSDMLDKKTKEKLGSLLNSAFGYLSPSSIAYFSRNVVPALTTIADLIQVIAYVMDGSEYEIDTKYNDAGTSKAVGKLKQMTPKSIQNMMFNEKEQELKEAGIDMNIITEINSLKSEVDKLKTEVINAEPEERPALREKRMELIDKLQKLKMNNSKEYDKYLQFKMNKSLNKKMQYNK